MKRILPALFVISLFTGTIRAADDPFVGKWKLDPAKSTLHDTMKVEAAGSNRYTFDFGGGNPEAILVDGTDQPGLFGTTLAVTAEAPGTWKVVRKKDGRMLVTGIWTLSADGRTLTDAFTSNQANGTTFRLNYIYTRAGKGSGFVGTWESSTEEVNSVYEIQIHPYGEDGLSFINAAQESKKDMKFDGKDYPDTGPKALPENESSARRVNARSIAMSDKVAGKVMDTQQMTVSPDGKALTITVQGVGGGKPKILVFDRE